MPRRLTVPLALVLAACGTDRAPAAQSASVADLPTGGPVAPVDGERQRLSTAQLLAYLPESVGAMQVGSVKGAGDFETTDDDGAVVETSSRVDVAYNLPARDGALPKVLVSIEDHIDGPEKLERVRQQFEGRYASGGSSMTFEDRTVAGLAAQAGVDDMFGPRLRMLIADRFEVMVSQTRSPHVEMEDLVAFVEASGIPQLAVAPASADAGTPDLPTWAAEDVAEAEASADRIRREREARARAAADVEPLRPCDEILTAADVAGVLGAPSVDIRPTPGVEVIGENCNRTYKPAGIEGGVILLISHYRDAAMAESALRVASDHGNKVGVQPLAGGLNGVRYTHDLSSDLHISHFALGPDFVELKATAALEDTPEITPAQLAEITAIVAGRLRE